MRKWSAKEPEGSARPRKKFDAGFVPERSALPAAAGIGRTEIDAVYKILKTSCPVEEHWRSKRAVRDLWEGVVS
ncbi:MAG: hypothetical protein EOP09_00955 [Proteobacteria bacterium]|nr:MAG: hypothetical protein EOP09_00955 [Pseudomonadota bacterium]